MKNKWQTKKLGLGIILVIIGIFCFLFFIYNQYWIAFFSLVLMIITYRLSDLENVKVSTSGVEAKFVEKDRKIQDIIKSDKPAKEKIEEVQKITDEIFKLGYVSGGGKSDNIFNVMIKRDDKGNAISVQYDEIP